MNTSRSSGFGEYGALFASGPASESRRAENASASFWNLRTLKEAPKSEIGEEVIERTPAGEVIVRDVTYDVPAGGERSIKAFAYYAYPAAKKGTKLPAIVWVHGGGSTADRNAVIHWASLGYAAFAMDLPGKGGESRAGSRSEGPDMSDQLIFKVSPSPTESYLYLCVNSVCRAISLLCEQKEVDPSRIGVLGYSWGGVITLLANGIDDRIAAACTVYGAGYIYQESCWTGGEYAKLSAKEKKTWRDHFDPSSYMKTQHGKTLFVGATQDTYYPLRSFVKTYREAGCAKALYLVLNKNHEMDETASRLIERWFDWALRSGPALPSIKLKQEKDSIEVRADCKPPVLSVSLAITDSADYARAEWTCTEITGQDGIWKAASQRLGPSALVIARDESGGAVAEVIRLAKAR